MAFPKDASEPQVLFGTGFQQVLTRNFMLHRGLSVLGWEDAGVHPLEEVLQREDDDCYFVGGALGASDEGFEVAGVVIKGQNVTEFHVTNSDLNAFIHGCGEAILNAVGLTLDQSLKKLWEVGQPSDFDDIMHLGLARVNGEDMESLSKARAHFIQKKKCTLWAHVGEDILLVQEFVELTEWDPYDGQLLFILFCRLNTSNKKPDLPAFQYVRRAIELAPGYGKAHMVANSTVPTEANLVMHAKLSVHLLPTNTFAYSNYFAFLYRRKQTPEDMSMIDRAISLDPHSMQPYFQGIEFYKWAGRYEDALNIALRLKKLATPPLSKRTIYCINQNPGRAKNYAEGKYNPLADVEKEIAFLQTKV